MFYKNTPKNSFKEKSFKGAKISRNFQGFALSLTFVLFRGTKRHLLKNEI